MGPGAPTAGAAPPPPPAVQAAPLTIATAAFAHSFAPDGTFQPRASVFEPASLADIYLVVSGFGARPITTGVRVEFQVGAQIRDATGKVLARGNEFNNLVLDRPTPPTRYQGGVSLNLPSLKAGSYVLRLTLRDAYTGRTGTADLPFTVMPKV